jgi:hypothetical protein
MKFGILLWFERKNTFNERAVVDGWFAMSGKVGANKFRIGIFTVTLWQDPHIDAAIWRPDFGLPFDAANAGICATNVRIMNA